MNTIATLCSGWLLVMDLATPTAQLKVSNITTTVVCVESELACRKAGASREVSLRNDLGLLTHVDYTFTCMDTHFKTKEEE